MRQIGGFLLNSRHVRRNSIYVFKAILRSLANVSKNVVDDVTMLLCGVYEIALRQDRILQGVADTVKVLTNIGIDAYLLPIPFNTNRQ